MKLKFKQSVTIQQHGINWYQLQSITKNEKWIDKGKGKFEAKIPRFWDGSDIFLHIG